MRGYTTLTSSVTGFRKTLEGRPCEDAVKVVHLDGATVMAIADGHGDRRCLFAHIGADIATRAVCEVLKTHFKASAAMSPCVYWNTHREAIAQDIVSLFRHSVISDYVERMPEKLTKTEAEELHCFVLEAYKQRKGKFNPEQIRTRYQHKKILEDRLAQIVYLYGTTVRASLLTANYLFNLALGDGDTVAVINDCVEWLLPASDAYESETASLCEDMNTVTDSFVFSFLELGTRNETVADVRLPLTMLSLSTDGLRNSFAGDDFFCEKIKQISVALHERNRRNTSRAIKNLFEKLTMESVFQDDITAAFVIETPHTLH